MGEGTWEEFWELLVNLCRFHLGDEFVEESEDDHDNNGNDYEDEGNDYDDDDEELFDESDDGGEGPTLPPWEARPVSTRRPLVPWNMPPVSFRNRAPWDVPPTTRRVAPKRRSDASQIQVDRCKLRQIQRRPQSVRGRLFSRAFSATHLLTNMLALHFCSRIGLIGAPPQTRS